MAKGDVFTIKRLKESFRVQGERSQRVRRSISTLRLVVLAELEKQFGEEVSSVRVGVDTRVREAQARGLPGCIYSPRSRSSVAYAALAREVEGLFVGEEVRRVQAA